MNDNDALTSARNALVSVKEGQLINDPSIYETFATEQEALGAADDLCSAMAGSERAPPLLSSSGSLAILAAICLASSRANTLDEVDVDRVESVLKEDVGDRGDIVVLDDERLLYLKNTPGRPKRVGLRQTRHAMSLRRGPHIRP